MTISYRATPGRSDANAVCAERQAGVCLHITSLPGDYGIGEIGAAAQQFMDAMSQMKLRVWQFLPTGPTAFGDSPYQSLSSFAGNELLIDTATLVDTGLVSPRQAERLAQLPAGAVDYAELIPRKLELLEQAATRFRSRATAADKSAYDRFLDEHDAAWLHDYALFRFLKTRYQQKPWHAWPPEFAHRNTVALRNVEAESTEQLDYIKIVQFLFYRQWQQLQTAANDRAIRLFADVPMYIALDSADAWSNREILLVDDKGRPESVAGVPPDYFNKNGQLWGNPLYDWKTLADRGYDWWIDRIGHVAALADFVRIDHFRGFEAYWSVAGDARTARDGEWQPGPGDALLNALREALGHLPIVAEDLGVITPEVEALRDRHHLPGMKVLQFEVSRKDFDIADIARRCVCYTGTHDNDTTVGWFNGSPHDTRSRKHILKTRKRVLEITNGRPETIHLDLTKLAFATPAQLAIVPMQDYLGLGSAARLNTPGTSTNNWRWRMSSSRIRPDLIDSVGEMVATAGRDHGH